MPVISVDWRCRSRFAVFPIMTSARPETRYAVTTDGVYIAYQVRGSGPDEMVVIPGFAACFETELEEPRFARMVELMAERWRVILFDKRGAGLSDRTNTPDMEMRADDLRAVLDAVGSSSAILLGQGRAAHSQPSSLRPIRNASRRWYRCTAGRGSPPPRTTRSACRATRRKRRYERSRTDGARSSMREPGPNRRCQAARPTRVSFGGWRRRCASQPLPERP